MNSIRIQSTIYDLIECWGVSEMDRINNHQTSSVSTGSFDGQPTVTITCVQDSFVGYLTKLCDTRGFKYKLLE